MLYIVVQAPKQKFRDVHKTIITVVEAKSGAEALRNVWEESDPAYCKPQATPAINGTAMRI